MKRFCYFLMQFLCMTAMLLLMACEKQIETDAPEDSPFDPATIATVNITAGNYITIINGDGVPLVGRSVLKMNGLRSA